MAETPKLASLHTSLDQIQKLDKSNPLAASQTTTVFFERSASAGVETMKAILQDMGASLQTPEKHEAWDKMSDGFCNLFDRYLKTRFETVQWCVSTVFQLIWFQESYPSSAKRICPTP